MSLMAQHIYAKTDDGKRVILKSDGTWAYVKTPEPRNSLYTPKRSTTGSKTSTSTRSNSRGRTYIRGPRGGCYYINGNGGKTYVDRSMCN